MNILWFKPILPFPPHSGTRRVTLQVLRNLSSRHRITLLTMLLHGGERGYVGELEQEVPGLRVVAPLAPNKRSPWHRLRYRAATRWQAMRGVPPIQSYTCFPEFLAVWRELADELHPDLAVAEYWFSKPFLDAVDGPAKVLFAHDIDYLVHEQAAKYRRDRVRSGRNAQLEAEAEKHALQQTDHHWFLTDRDKAAAEALGSPGGAVLPYGLDLDGELAERRESDPAQNPMDILLFGSYFADFNRDALDFTLEEIWPEIRRLQPRAKLRVAGNGLPEGYRRRLHAAGVQVDGPVENLRQAYLSAAVILIPLRFCGGLRIRLLEALALQCAVVGTTQGVLGMGARAESEVLAADTGKELAGQVARLLEEPDLRIRLGRSGRDWVLSNHAMPAAAAEQLRLVENLSGR